MPRAGWLATGGIAVALVAVELGAAAALAGCAGLIGVAGVAFVVGDRRLPFAALGATLVAGRVLVGAVGMPAAEEPPAARDWDARVASVSAPSGGSQRAILEVAPSPAKSTDGRASSDGQPPVADTWRVYARLPRYPVVAVGDEFTFTASLEERPHGTPFAEYLERSRVAATVEVREIRPASGANTGDALQRTRVRAAEALATALPEPEAGLAAGILIGLRERVSRAVADAFTTSGLSHVVAISGWNIAIVGGVVAAAFGRLPRRWRSLAIGLAIVVYAIFAGASASVLRAALMAGTALLARESGRRGAAPTALGIAALAMLVLDPDNVSDAGYQLSVAATAGLLRWSAAFTSHLSAALPRATPGWLVESLGVSLSAQLATLPLVLASFGRLSLVAPLANLAAAPLVAPAMGFSLVALGAGAAVSLGLPGSVASALALPAWALLGSIVAIAERAAALPMASVELQAPWSLVVAAAAAIVIAAASGSLHRGAIPRRVGASLLRFARPAPSAPVAIFSAKTASRRARRTPVVALGIAVAASGIWLLGLAVTQSRDARFSISVLDVGQGDAILLEGGRGGRILVDGGPDPDRLLALLDARLPPWDRRLDVVVLTHPHEDHVAGFPLLLRRYRVGELAEPGMRGPGPGYRAFAEQLGAEKRSTRTLAAGDRLVLDGSTISVLWPLRGSVPASPPDTGTGINNVSIVLDVRYGARRFLLTGDVEQEIDPELLREGLGSAPVDVLKVAHHGSGTATTDSLLGAIDPRVAIVSAGAGNRYGHPSPRTLERIATAGAQVFRTDRDGSITVSTDGTDLRVSVAGPRPRAAPPAVPVVAAAGWNCAVAGTPPVPTIGAWRSLPATRPQRSSSSSIRPAGSWRTRVPSPRLPRSWPPAHSNATANAIGESSMPPRSSTTSTSWYRAYAVSTARPARSG